LPPTLRQWRRGGVRSIFGGASTNGACGAGGAQCDAAAGGAVAPTASGAAASSGNNFGGAAGAASVPANVACRILRVGYCVSDIACRLLRVGYCVSNIARRGCCDQSICWCEKKIRSDPNSRVQSENGEDLRLESPPWGKVFRLGPSPPGAGISALNRPPGQGSPP